MRCVAALLIHLPAELPAATTVSNTTAVFTTTGDGFSVEHDTIPCLIDLLHPSHSSKGVQEMAAFALARLAQLRSHQAAIAQVRSAASAVVRCCVVLRCMPFPLPCTVMNNHVDPVLCCCRAPSCTLNPTPQQHGGLQALLMLLSSDNSNSSAGAQYNAAYALYELCEESEQALHLQQQGGLQQLHVSRERLQVRCLHSAERAVLRDVTSLVQVSSSQQSKLCTSVVKRLAS